MKSFASTLALLLSVWSLSAADAKPQQPDLIVILCDDFNPFYAGFAGDPDAKTPHLDELAKESAQFTQCYSASTVCMPARTSFITGLFPHNTGCWGNTENQFIPPHLTSMFSDLRLAGYSTAMIGKTHWYSGPAFRQQFDDLNSYMDAIGIDHYEDVATTFGSRNGRGIYQDFLRRIGKFESQSADLTARLKENQYVARPSLLKPEETCDWMMLDLAIEHLDDAPEDQPLAMMVGLSNPHSPFDPSAPYSNLYDPESLFLRDNVKPFQKYGTEYDLATIREARAAYLGKITFIDDLVGRLINALKDRGTWDNTVVVFTADHGIAIGEHGVLAKGGFWEETARVPLLIRHPALTTQGMVSDSLIQLIDLYPTLVDLAGGTTSDHVLGQSLMPILDGSAPDGREVAFTEIHYQGELGYMVRDQRYKWFAYRGSEALFDLERDPNEMNNLIHSPAHSEAVSRMKDHLREFLMESQVNHSEGYRPMADRVNDEG